MVKITTVRLLQSYTFFKLSRALFRSARARAGVANKLRAPDSMPDPGFPCPRFQNRDFTSCAVLPPADRKSFQGFCPISLARFIPSASGTSAKLSQSFGDAADLYKSFERFLEFHGSGVPITYSISLNRYFLSWPSALWRTSSSPPGCTPVIVPRNCCRVRPSVYRCSCPSR